MIGIVIGMGAISFRSAIADDSQTIDRATVARLLASNYSSEDDSFVNYDQVYKWTQRNIRYSFVSDSDVSELDSQVGQFASILGDTTAALNLERTNDTASADIIILYSSRLSDILTRYNLPIESLTLPVGSKTGEELLATAENYIRNYSGNCKAIVSYAGKPYEYEIGKAFIFVSNTMDETLTKKCLLSDLVSAIGLRDGFVSGATVLSVDRSYSSLTANDIAALKILYLSQVFAGETVGQVLSAQNIISNDIK